MGRVLVINIKRPRSIGGQAIKAGQRGGAIRSWWRRIRKNRCRRICSRPERFGPKVETLREGIRGSVREIDADTGGRTISAHMREDQSSLSGRSDKEHT